MRGKRLDITKSNLGRTFWSEKHRKRNSESQIQKLKVSGVYDPSFPPFLLDPPPPTNLHLIRCLLQFLAWIEQFWYYYGPP